MSRGAYEAHFGQAAPPGALFGVDISWYQAATEAGPDWGIANGYWSDFGGWADFVCVRTSYGAGSWDGAEGLHFQVAAEHGYQKPMGTYHFVYANRGVEGNAANYLASSERFVDRTSFDMLDFEAAPVASGAFVSELCDRIEQARQRPCLIYGGKSYLDQSGPISCPAEKLWVAQYAAARSNAWVPTTDWSSWDAPLVPDQFDGQYPGVWQWSSFTPQHGHLDLNISTTPAAFGGQMEEEDLTPDQAATLDWLKSHLLASDMGALALLRDIYNYGIWNNQMLIPMVGQLQTVYWNVGNFPASVENEKNTTAGRLAQIQAALAHLQAGDGGEVAVAPPVDKAAVLADCTIDELVTALKAALKAQADTSNLLAVEAPK